MQSISQARHQWSEATKPDQLLMEEHERRLGEVITGGIKDGSQFVRYEVPWLIHGPWPIYDVNEITLELIRRARHRGYHVSMIRQKPPMLEVSGWATSKSRYHKPLVSSAAAPPSKKSAGRPKKERREVTLNDARRGVISSKLRQRLARLN